MNHPPSLSPSGLRRGSDQDRGGSAQITTALLLAAGVGTRLWPLTRHAPKCLIEVAGEPMLSRLVRSLTEHGFKRLLVVLGHLGGRIEEYLATNARGLAVDFVYSSRYATTNNLYSLLLARDLIQEPFLLVESDVVFDPQLLSGLLVPDRVAVAKRLPGMMGTTVLLDESRRVTAFAVGQTDQPDPAALKTVNIYSLSRRTWELTLSRLDERADAGQINDYYEVVFAELVAEGRIRFEGVSFDHGRWIEVDTTRDLQAADRLFRGSQRKEEERTHTFHTGDQ